MSEHDDRQLEAYLAGDSPLSEHYRLAGEDAPPATLDARVLAQARQAIGGDIEGVEARRRWRWIAPISTAAVVVLAAALVLEMTLPGDPSMSRLVDESTDAIEVSPAAAPGRAEPAAARERTSMDRARSTVGVEAVDAREPKTYQGAIPMPAPAAVERAAPTSDALSAAPSRQSQDRSSTMVQDADAPGDESVAEAFAKPLAVERAARAARDMAPASAVAGFAEAPGEDIDVSDDRLQALSLMTVLGLVDDGREDEAVRMLDDVLERWPDLELPDDFPLPDPREDP